MTGTRPQGTHNPWQAVRAAFSGSFIEWYDFYLFGTAAGLIFPVLFFPGDDPTVSTIESFGAFAAGFLTRPLGALLFGHFGDRIGRKPMLLITVLLIGGATAVIGLLPTHDAIGSWAAVLLIGMRLLQGIGIGGEFGGGTLLALESAPTGRRGFMGSFHQMGTPAGLLVSSGVIALVTLLPDEQLYSWGWRLPFLLSGVFVVIALVMRSRVPETTAFQSAGTVARVPLFHLLRFGWKNLLLGIGARLADAVTFNVINVFAISFATVHLGLDKQMILTGFVIAAAVEFALLPLIGALSDRIGRRPVYLFGVIVCGIGGLLYFPILATQNTLFIWLAIVVLVAVGTGCMFGIQGAFFAEMFDTPTRYTGLGVVYQGSSLIGAAPTPAIALTLSAAFGFSYWPPALFLVGVCAISAVCVLLARETSMSDLIDNHDTAQAEPALAQKGL
ncbi:MFS transporter [Brachybacterium sp. YJGR34]|uniref:MFS transporter n=1 Tax=Brachybacterium sp. YJGR34 TaxID=2059911 RepID=UPI000E0A81D2|nr:MFS transporter [Brachybacterium sp. YJGR34]